MPVKKKEILSFSIDHERLKPGLYVSRYDEIGPSVLTTFDLRFVAPNSGREMSTAGIHTLEHLFATLMRGTDFYGSQVVYVGPMGCRTGMYVVVVGKWLPEEMIDWILEVCDEIIRWNDIIPGATSRECGNANDHSLVQARQYAQEYAEELRRYRRFEYPE